MEFIWPLEPHTISRDFEYPSSIYINGQHGAVDIPASIGTPVKAVASGLVTKAAYNDISGYYVEIAHDGGWVTNYRHFVEQAPINVDDNISQGQTIGKVGSTGWSTGPHLHFDLWNSIKQSPEAMYKVGIWAHDPELYLGKEEDDMTPQEVRDIVRAMKFHSEDREGNLEESVTTLSRWFGVLNEHRKDKGKHDSGSGAIVSEEKARSIAREEDAKLKVTK